MLPINKAVYVEDTFCYKDYVCQVSKLQYMYVIGLRWNIFFKFKWKVLKQINPNLAGLSRVCFYPLAPTRLLVWIPYLHLNSPHTYLTTYITNSHTYLVYTTSLNDLCFNKKFEQEKKVYIKIFLNRFILIIIIIVTQRDVLSP